MIAARPRAGLPDWLVIARREFLERLRTRWFVAVTLLGPILMIGVIVIPQVLAHAADKSARVQIVDHSGRLGAPLAAALTKLDWKPELVAADTSEPVLLRRIADDKIDGFLVIPASLPTTGTVVYQGDNATNMQAMLLLRQVTNLAAQQLRGLDAKLAPETLARMLMPIGFEQHHTTGEAGGGSGMGAFFVGYAVMFALYISIVLYAANVLRSVVQEKTNRIMEIMVAAAKPRALMLGKILGVGGVGLIQITIWAGMSIVTMTYRGPLLGFFGVAAAASWSVPPMTAVDLVVVLGYFVLGYFFYAAIFAAIGAMVSSEQEAQQAQTPVMMLLVIPVLSVQLISNDPRGPVSELLTQVPFSSAVLMPMRWMLGGATTASLLISMAILAASTLLVTRLAARIYRVGILMYGKRPTLRELGRWLRY